MKRIFLTTTTLALICGSAMTAAAQTSAKEPTDATAAIKAGGQEFMAAAARGDAAALAALYTKDAQLLPAGHPIVSGRDAIQKYWEGALDRGLKGVKLETVEVYGSAAGSDSATEVGTYTVSGAGEKPLDEGKFIVVWKREDGKWRLHRDMFSSNRPPSPQE